MDHKKIILTADSTCDLSGELIDRFRVNLIPYHIVYDDREYLDGVDIHGIDILENYKKSGKIPKTACISAGEYMEFFRKWTEQGYEVVHLNLSSTISTSHQNAVIAAQELGGVYPVDTLNLSTGSGLLVLEAAERIEAGKQSAAEIANDVAGLTAKAHSSFILDNLEFMKKGGRCSSLVAMSANLLKIKPCIEMNADGVMNVFKKFMGDLEKTMPEYARDMLSRHPDYRTEKIFITTTPDMPRERIDLLRAVVEEAGFRNIYETYSGCTITSHCGPQCSGILFMTK